MTIQEMLDALGDGGAIRVISRSGKMYDVERDVITANAKEADPYIYGWPVVPRHNRRHGRAQWFYAKHLHLAEVDDQVSI